MNNKRQIIILASAAIGGCVFTVAGILLFKAGLNDADKWASIIGMIATVSGIPLTLYGIKVARRPTGEEPDNRKENENLCIQNDQRIIDTSIYGNNLQIGQARDVSIGHTRNLNNLQDGLTDDPLANIKKDKNNTCTMRDAFDAATTQSKDDHPTGGQYIHGSLIRGNNIQIKLSRDIRVDDEQS